MTVTINGTTGINAPGLSIEGTPVGLKVDVQEFTASGTWTKPTGAKLVYVEIWGGGGGGGSGRRGAAGSNRLGGSGGSGSYPFIGSFRADELTSTVSVTIGAGGAGGAAITVNDTNGNPGASGGSSSFGGYVTVMGGQAGQGNSQIRVSVPFAAPSQQFGQSISVGVGVVGSYFGAGGGSIFIYGGESGYGFPTGSKGTSGGGGGGYISSSNLAYTAGLGGSYFNFPTDTVGGVTGNGVGNGVNGAAGADFGLGGGGGGTGNSVTAGSGGAGGTAAGGGGGGGSLNGYNSGAGGNGGDGFCRVTTYY